MTTTATYSPDDNKLRIYPAGRLSADEYAAVRAAGYRWAPKVGAFVAPAWTPAREDLAVQMAGQIDDEDSTLAERAEDRAERFSTYEEHRRADANAAARSADDLNSLIPAGQPILVGHHSEKRHRKHLARIDALYTRASDNWKTAEYWQQRARAALAHAKHKERPDVRARRIRTIEAEQRKQQARIDTASRTRALWAACTTATRAAALAAWDYSNANALETGIASWEDVRARALDNAARIEARAQRWIAHCARRLEYERAMLAGDGGIATDRTRPEVGGAVQCWAAPAGGWCYVVRVNRVSVSVLDNWGNGGPNFSRTIPFDKVRGIMTRADVDAARAEGRIIETEARNGFHLAAQEAVSHGL